MSDGLLFVCSTCTLIVHYSAVFPDLCVSKISCSLGPRVLLGLGIYVNGIGVDAFNYRTKPSRVS